MAKPQIVPTLAIILLLLFGVASGSNNIQSDETNNYSTDLTQQNDASLIGVGDEKTSSGHASTLLTDPNHFEDKINSLKQLNVVKRAPNGFIGMRGKKESDGAEANPGSQTSNQNSLLWYDMESMATDEPSNAEYDDTSYPLGERFKKASNAFYGVRGKKYTDFAHLNEMLLKVEEDRLRELMLQDFLDRLGIATSADNEINKRAPIGFTGVRGKKDQIHQFYKRSPAEYSGIRGKQQRFIDFTNKFVAVRGKKASSNAQLLSSDMDDDLLSAELPTNDLKIERGQESRFGPALKQRHMRYLVNMLPSLLYGTSGKRTPSGFLGMRGKRSIQDSNINTVSGTVKSLIRIPRQ